MKLNKKYFLTIFTLLGMHLVGGVSLANAVPCEDALRATWDKTSFYTSDQDDHRGTYRKGDRVKEIYISAYTPYYSATTYEMALEKFPQMVIGFAEDDGGKDCKAAAEYISSSDNTMRQCIGKYLVANNCDISAFKNSRSAQKSNSSASSSSNQSSLPQPSTQTASSQSAASTQAINNKKSKKNPNDVPAKCVGFNHDKTKIVNKCNFPINFSYCMLHQDDQSISIANSCNDGFVDETVYPGRAISDESLDTRFFAISCKFPSKPINMRFISYNEPVEGNCSR